jgi:ABC-type hemin transport system substrate-binding protein
LVGRDRRARRPEQANRSKDRMKSAYELAMERLEKASPSISLTEDQKKEIAEVDSVYRAKIAEKELFLKDQIRKAQGAGNLEEAESLEKQLASQIRRLQEDCETKKEKLRASFAK